MKFASIVPACASPILEKSPRQPRGDMYVPFVAIWPGGSGDGLIPDDVVAVIGNHALSD